MREQRTYAVMLQIVVTAEREDYEWEDMEAQMQDTGSYTLLAPWESDVIAAMVPGIDGEDA